MKCSEHEGLQGALLDAQLAASRVGASSESEDTPGQDSLIRR
jgi:hypothetical protein